MGKIIIECPKCQHVRKMSDHCDTCSQEREWEVKYGRLTCKTCKYGWSSMTCEACAHTIPTVEDFVKYYPDYADFEGQLSDIVDTLLGMHRHKLALAVLDAPWVKYELPTGYPLTEKRGEVATQRNLWIFGALLVGAAMGGFAGAGLLPAIFDASANLGVIAGVVGGAVLAATFARLFAGQWGTTKGILIDGGLILLLGALGSLAVIFVLGGIILWIVFSMFTGH